MPASSEIESESWSRSTLWAHWNRLRGDGYELDEIERFLEGDKPRVQCSPESMVDYAGTALRYAGAVRVNPPFVPRLALFEEVVKEVATEVYGRAPHRIRHYGAYSCRTSRNRSYRLSEHSLGNAIDIIGFDFARAKKDEWQDAGRPRELRGPFQVRVAKHWAGSARPAAVLHAQFLRKLTERLTSRDDIFRGLIGPGHPGHSDHFHFDVAPWRYTRL
jgi:hypothetical protein